MVEHVEEAITMQSKDGSRVTIPRRKNIDIVEDCWMKKRNRYKRGGFYPGQIVVSFAVFVPAVALVSTFLW